MQPKLLFFDIDGTLVEEGNFNIPNSAIEAIKKAQINGHKCFINTGRPIGMIEKKLIDLNFDGYICTCGTYVEYNRQIIFHTKIPRKQCRKLIKVLYECKMNAVLEGKDTIYFPSNMDHYRVTKFYNYYTRQGFKVSLYTKDSDIEFEKIACWYNGDGKIGVVKEYVLSMGLKIIDRDNDFIEIIPSNCSKAKGIEVITKYLNVSLDETISFGDSKNDIEMFEITKVSVAMKNANPCLFNKATYITTTIDDNGIYNALKYLKLL